MKKVLLLVSCIILFGCNKQGVEKIQTNNDEFSVTLLFEHDGCKVYRFYDSKWIYYTNCSGNVEWEVKEGKAQVKQSVSTND